ncbi:MAG: SpoIIE family protein phosphatase [Planctomycetes bacterium]|nr:SpoIIE family protein phosphatase [Planctomycetota bacterium]
MADSFRVLVVEDNPLDVRVIAEHLARSRYASFQAEIANSVVTALDKLNSDRFSVVLLDLSLGSTIGLETFRLIQGAHPRVPIVILTGTNHEETALVAMQNGAQDYLLKDRISADSLARALRYAIERHSRRQLEDRMRETNAELRIAQQIQHALFPRQAPQLAGFDLAGTWHPAQATCGDYFDFFPMGDRHLGIAVGDVCGHGLGPGLVMAETRAVLRSLAPTHLDVSEIMTLANRLLAQDLDGQRFVTLFFARLNLDTRALSYAGAGHRAYLMHAAGDVEMLDSTSMPLGLDTTEDVECVTGLTLMPEDLLLIVTDGVEEATSPSGHMFGRESLLQLVRGFRHEPARRIVDHLVHEHLHSFINNSAPDDDFTAVVLKVDHDNQTNGKAS